MRILGLTKLTIFTIFKIVAFLVLQKVVLNS